MNRKVAVFTIVQNEPTFLPVWSRYYQSHVPSRDLFVLDHDSTDATTITAARELNYVPVHRNESFNHHWLRDVVERFQSFLLESYELVLFAEVDEIVAPDPQVWPQGLGQFLDNKPMTKSGYIRCTGYDIVHQRHQGEPALDWNLPLLGQRRFCRRSKRYSKPLLAGHPLQWEVGFHRLRPRENLMSDPDPELLLLHLHRVDYDTCRAKTLENASRRWSAADVSAGYGYQNRIVHDDEFERWFHTDFDDTLYEVEPFARTWESIV